MILRTTPAMTLCISYSTNLYENDRCCQDFLKAIAFIIKLTAVFKVFICALSKIICIHKVIAGVADRREDRPSMYYPIKIDGVEVYPIKEDGTDGRWRVGESMAKELLAEGVLELTEKNGKYNIYRNFPSGISYTPYDTLLLYHSQKLQGKQSV